MSDLQKISTYSPLRYPGGKASLSGFFMDIAEKNDLCGGTYVELFAGGAGAALSLLFNKTFERIHINDFDVRIYSMWSSIIFDSVAFIKLIEESEVSVSEWSKQKAIYEEGDYHDQLKLGFATFYLNRTNRSGIIHKAGPIGGKSQNGQYKIDVRFNKRDLIRRIELISSRKNDIRLTNHNASDIIEKLSDYYGPDQKTLLYLDPPYYNKGRDLYLNNYSHFDHVNLSNKVRSINPAYKWIISYDNVDPIRSLYFDYRMSTFDFTYTLQAKKQASELLVFSQSLELCDVIRINNKYRNLEMINIPSHE